MKKINLITGACIIAMSLIQIKVNAQLRITGTSGTLPGPVQVSATNTSSMNVILGNSTGDKGTENTFIGNAAAWSVSGSSTASENTIIGRIAGGSLASGNKNTFVGNISGYWNSDGSENSIFGYGAGASSAGSFNTFIGRNSGSNSKGSNNTFLGWFSGSNNGTGSFNTFLGQESGKNNTTGSSNIAIGYNSGFSPSSNWSNAIAIGYNSVAGNHNSMALGGPGNTNDAVKVGIGTGSIGGFLAPQADLHIYKTTGNVGTEILSHWGNTTNQSALTLRTGFIGSTKDLWIRMYGTTSPTTLLLGSTSVPPILGAPSLPTTTDNLALIATQASPLMIGINPNNSESGASENIYFVNNINTYAGKKAWECMRINKENGFVGIHTRTAASGLGTGEPQALFHVNLTNPAKGYGLGTGLNKFTQGIRFEGLGYSDPPNTQDFPDVVVIDNVGNLAKKPISTLIGGSTIDWHTNGNTLVTPFTEFIGTLNDYDFRIQTNGQPRARFTSSTGAGGTPKYGNFELGSGSTFLGSTDKSVAFGESNILNSSKNVLSSGSGNEIKNSSNNSGTVGVSNKIDASHAAFASGNSNNIKSTSNNSTASGEGNIIDNSINAIAGGKQNSISNAENCLVSGFSNEIEISNGVFSSGAKNGIYLNSNNSGAFGELNTITNSARTFVTGYQNTINTSSENSGAMGNLNSIIGSQNAFTMGFNNTITNVTLTSPLVGSDNSGAIGENNSIKRSPGSFAAGSGNIIEDADGGGCIVLGGNGNKMTKSHASLIGGEQNEVENGHGTLVAGGHNYSDGAYNTLIGQNLFTIASTSTKPSSMPSYPIYPNIMILGNYLNSTLNNSLTVGFDQNRTSVTTKRGLAVQLEASTVVFSGTYIPTANFEVEAGFPTPGIPLIALPAPSSLRSNIRFHHLPSINTPLPTVLIDPTTGELFMSQSRYPNPLVVDDSSSYLMIADLKKSIENQKEQIANQQKQIDELMASVKLLTEIKKENNKSSIEQNIVLSDKEAILLYQNVPNPFDGQTSIAYYIPSSVRSAVIRFTNLEGKVIKSVPLTEKGKGLININASDLSQGMYNYSLYVDGALIDTKKMMLK